MEETTEERRGVALVRAMRALHMSNGTLAEMVGVSVHTVTMWRSTGRLPSAFYLGALASAMVWSDAELGAYVRGRDLSETTGSELEAEKVRHAKTRAAHAAVLLQTRTAHEALLLQRQEMRRKEIKRTDAAMDELFEKQLRQGRELKAIERERDFLQASVRTLEAEGLQLAIAGEE